MYIQRLIEFAEGNEDKFPPIGFKNKKIDWIVDLEATGLTVSPASKQQMIVPDVARSSGTKPILFVDKPDYVFGYADSEEQRARSEERQKAFIELLKQFALETGDHDTEQLIDRLQTPPERPAKMKLGDIIAIRVRDEEFLHDKKSVKPFWAKQVKPVTEKGSFINQCIFCGAEDQIVQRHSIDFLIGTDRTKMISANKNAFESHGLKNSYSAPTCYVCEQKYGKALEYLLQPYPKTQDKPGGPHMVQIGGVTYVYWLRRSKVEIPLAEFVQPSPQSTEDLRDLLMQTLKGIPIERNTNQFCLLAMTANKGRLVVREYSENSIGYVTGSIERFFDAQNVGAKRYYGIYTLAATAYSEARNQMKAHVIEEWMNWFFRGRRLSKRIIIPILKRIQAKGTMYPQDAAAIKSWLVSQGEGREQTVALDFNNQSVAHILGRVFAVLENIQQTAINSDNTIASKYFGSASTTPLSVMGLLIRNAQHHLAKIRNEKPGLAVNLDKKLSGLLANIDEIPPTLNLTDQSEFALGYYQEKQELWTSKQKEEV